MTNLALPTLSAEGGLSNYFREVWEFPFLEKEEEQMLAVRLRDMGDADAAHLLVTSHLRLVCKIAMGYRGYGLPVADLISEGNVGLMRAVKGFDPDRGFRLSTYAMWWIRAAITEYVLKSWSLVRTGTVASQKKLFFSLRKLKNRLGIKDGGDLTSEEAAQIADLTKVPADQIQAFNRRMSTRDLSLNAPKTIGDESSMEYQDTLVDEGPSPEVELSENETHALRLEIIGRALEQLPERERDIFTARRLSDEPPTLEQLGEVYDLSRERIRQLEKKAYEAVESFVRQTMARELPGEQLLSTT